MFVCVRVHAFAFAFPKIYLYNNWIYADVHIWFLSVCKKWQGSLFAWHARTAVGTWRGEAKPASTWRHSDPELSALSVGGDGEGGGGAFLFHTTQGQRSAPLRHSDGSVSEKETETVIPSWYWMKKEKKAPARKTNAVRSWWHSCHPSSRQNKWQLKADALKNKSTPFKVSLETSRFYRCTELNRAPESR